MYSTPQIAWGVIRRGTEVNYIWVWAYRGLVSDETVEKVETATAKFGHALWLNPTLDSMPHILHAASKLASQESAMGSHRLRLDGTRLYLPTNRRARLQSVFLRGNQQSPCNFGIKTS